MYKWQFKTTFMDTLVHVYDCGVKNKCPDGQNKNSFANGKATLVLPDEPDKLPVELLPFTVKQSMPAMIKRDKL